MVGSGGGRGLRAGGGQGLVGVKGWLGSRVW